jgi:hypothetical protein
LVSLPLALAGELAMEAAIRLSRDALMPPLMLLTASMAVTSSSLRTVLGTGL